MVKFFVGYLELIIKIANLSFLFMAVVLKILLCGGTYTLINYWLYKKTFFICKLIVRDTVDRLGISKQSEAIHPIWFKKWWIFLVIRKLTAWSVVVKVQHLFLTQSSKNLKYVIFLLLWIQFRMTPNDFHKFNNAVL
jgi:hypothetical protein